MDAEGHFDRALLLDRSLEEARIEAGIAYELRGELTRSMAMLRSVDTNAINKVAAARRSNALGTALFLSNDADSALREHRRALSLARAAHDRRLEAEALIGIGRVLYHAKGRADESSRHLERSLAIARDIGNEGVEAGALRHLAVVRWWLGGERGTKTLALTEAAIAKYRRVHDLRGEAIAISNLGMMHGSRLDTVRSMQLQNASIRIKQRIGDRAGLADSWSVLADNYASLRNYRKAGEYLARALETSREIGYRLNENDVEAKLAQIYVLIGELDAAIPLFERLLERERGNPMLSKIRTAYLADVHRLRGEPAESLRWAHRAFELDRAIGQPDRQFAFDLWALVADAEMARNNLEEAQRALDRSDEAAAQLDLAWSLTLRPCIIRAELLARLGRREEALTWLRASADHEIEGFQNVGTRVVWAYGNYWYDRLFSFLLGPDGSPILAARFLEQLRYRSLLDVVARSGDVSLSSADREEALARARDTAQRLLRAQSHESRARDYAEYENAVVQPRLEHEALAHARLYSIDEIRAVLDGRTAIVEYLMVARSLYALVITPNGVRSVPLPVSSDAAGTKIRLLRALLFETHQATEWLPVATDLRRVLIEPLETSGALRSVERLEIVPWGALRDLPFAVLVRENGRFLVEDYVISYAPSASAAVRARRRVESGDGPAVFFGLGRFPGEELPQLPQAEEEARQISERVGGEVRLGTDATESEVARVAPRARAMHFATHAVSEPDMPLLSRLVLAPEEGSDGNLTVVEVLTMPLRAELVTLGACRTAESHSSGRNESELERVGLVEAFLHAGARAVLASLAPVGDHSTSVFMRAYYAEGVPSDPAERLAAIQRAMIRRHPRDWGAFVVFGGAP